MRARFTSMNPIRRFTPHSNTPKARRVPPVRQFSRLLSMNVATVAGVLRPPLTHFAISSSSPARWSAASSGVRGRRKITLSVNVAEPGTGINDTQPSQGFSDVAAHDFRDCEKYLYHFYRVKSVYSSRSLGGRIDFRQ